MAEHKWWLDTMAEARGFIREKNKLVIEGGDGALLLMFIDCFTETPYVFATVRSALEFFKTQGERR